MRPCPGVSGKGCPHGHARAYKAWLCADCRAEGLRRHAARKAVAFDGMRPAERKALDQLPKVGIAGAMRVFDQMLKIA